jgi:DNA-directed RNA polymerase
MYKSSDVLEEFYDNIIRLLPPDKREALPPPPGKGNLDIEGVLNCDFFFS